MALPSDKSTFRVEPPAVHMLTSLPAAGDYTGSFPCTTNDWNGQTFTVYDQSNLVGGNNEIVW